jgi:hypothetical protein
VELTEGSWKSIYAYDDGVVRITGSTGELFAVKDNAAVYVISLDKTEYTAGSLSDIRKDWSVRLYDMTDDDDNSADIVVIYKVLLD